MLERAGLKVRGANLLIQGEIPIGAGLSSSAAIEVATAYALLSLSGHDVDGVSNLGRAKIARICGDPETKLDKEI